MSSFGICGTGSYGPNYNSIRSVQPTSFSISSLPPPPTSNRASFTYNPRVYGFGYYQTQMGFPFYYRSYFVGDNIRELNGGQGWAPQ